MRTCHKKEPTNCHAVMVNKDGIIIGHLLRKVVRTVLTSLNLKYLKGDIFLKALSLLCVHLVSAQAVTDNTKLFK